MKFIPRYKINVLWGWWGFVQDNANGKFCEYRDYERLFNETKDYRSRIDSLRDENNELRREIYKLRSDLEQEQLSHFKMNLHLESLGYFGFYPKAEKVLNDLEKVRKHNKSLIEAGNALLKIAYAAGDGEGRVEKFDAWRKARRTPE